MILAIDMGNTNIVVGCIDNEKTYFIERLSTDKSKTAMEYAVSFKTVLELYSVDISKIEGVIISSVVPPLIHTVASAVEKIVRESQKSGTFENMNPSEKEDFIFRSAIMEMAK